MRTSKDKVKAKKGNKDMKADKGKVKKAEVKNKKKGKVVEEVKTKKKKAEAVVEEPKKRGRKPGSAKKEKVVKKVKTLDTKALSNVRVEVNAVSCAQLSGEVVDANADTLFVSTRRKGSQKHDVVTVPKVTILTCSANKNIKSFADLKGAIVDITLKPTMMMIEDEKKGTSLSTIDGFTVCKKADGSSYLVAQDAENVSIMADHPDNSDIVSNRGRKAGTSKVEDEEEDEIEEDETEDEEEEEDEIEETEDEDEEEEEDDDFSDDDEEEEDEEEEEDDEDFDDEDDE